MASTKSASAKVSGVRSATSPPTAKAAKANAGTPAKAGTSARKTAGAKASDAGRTTPDAGTGNAGKSTATAAKKPSAASASAAARKPPARNTAAPGAATPKRLAGGNPQIAKGDGDAPVQAYIAAMPGWKRAAGARLDALIERTVPGVRKAVKWNSPLYGVGDDNGWFLSLHVFANYIKIAFFAGRDLDPMPPGESKTARTRYLNLREGELDEAQFVAWVKQASRLPGERM